LAVTVSTPIFYSCPAAAHVCPITRENVDLNLQTIHMMGKEVYKAGSNRDAERSQESPRSGGLSIEDIACVIPHQANVRIIEAIADRLGISRDKHVCESRLVTVNTSGSSGSNRHSTKPIGPGGLSRAITF